MPSPNEIARGNEAFSAVYRLSAVTYPTLGANASSTTTITFNGIQQDDFISWNIRSIPAHLTVDNIWASAANTLSVTWGTDATGVTGATCDMLLEVVRMANISLGVANVPSAIT